MPGFARAIFSWWAGQLSPLVDFFRENREAIEAGHSVEARQRSSTDTAQVMKRLNAVPLGPTLHDLPISQSAARDSCQQLLTCSEGAIFGIVCG